MKKLFLLITAVLLICGPAAAQHMERDDMGPDGNRGPDKKIEELEKIKLIDALNMDENTTLKFFARRNKFRSEMKQMGTQADDVLAKINTELDKGKNVDQANLKSLISQLGEIQVNIAKKRGEFVNSLSDILTTEQIAKMLVFEKKFRDEIRRALFHERMKHRR